MYELGSTNISLDLPYPWICVQYGHAMDIPYVLDTAGSVRYLFFFKIFLILHTIGHDMTRFLGQDEVGINI